jgi:molybdopterin synthase catalytic subunit
VAASSGQKNDRRGPGKSVGAVGPYHWGVASIGADTWLELTESVLAIDDIYQWAVRADCGAVVLFSGTVRDHAEGRPGVSRLTYEAYAEQVEPRLSAIANEMRERWSSLGAIALIHRVGALTPTESSVVVCVSSPHRSEGFEAARFGIDAVKATVPIWKSEQWDGGQDWGLSANAVSDLESAFPKPVSAQ